MINIPGTNLKEYEFFSSLSDGALEALSHKMQSVEIPAGTRIIKEGEPAHAFYVICSGDVEVTQETGFGQTAKLRVEGTGESFGEMALLTNLPRSSTVTAKTDVKLSKISREDFEEVVNIDTAFSNMLERQAKDFKDFNALKTLQPFALIEPEKMLALIAKMGEETYSAGDIIISQGDQGDRYCIIKSGKAAVIKKEGDKEPEQIAVLKSGEGFGEESLIRGHPRNATVKALDETTVLTIDKIAFNQIMASSFIENGFSEDIPENERGNYVYIDARIRPEYEEEHIAGAFSIPIEILREKFGELDKEKEYFTYCTNDSRGMTAAFLMKSLGYKVKALRGGLSAWDGPTTRGGDGIYTQSAGV